MRVFLQLFSVIVLLITSTSGCSDRESEPGPPTFSVSPGEETVAVGTEVTFTVTQKADLLSGWTLAYEWWTLDDVSICRGKTCVITKTTAQTVTPVYHVRIYGKASGNQTMQIFQNNTEEEYDWDAPTVTFE
ncbi:MAG: hypothetical protein HQM12_15640 [SAR324 cluster bacterium]|nr:hypothetical protein [SAR324 cluster bacterium]